jgi:two-component system, OmpR family, sensor histidine kinase CpxA
VAAPIATERPARLQKGSSRYRTLKDGRLAEEASVSLKVKSRVLRLRTRVPVQRLFVKIFLWFWLTTLAMFAVFAGTRMIGLRPIRQSELIAIFAPQLAAEAAQAYESGGAPAFLRFTRSLVDSSQKRQLYLLDSFGNDVLSRPISPQGRLVAQGARTNGPVVVRYGLRQRIAAYKFASSSGRPYVLLFYVEPGLGDSWETLVGHNFLVSGGLLFTVTALCLWLAYHIASPIHGIQAAARMVAQGDLSAKAPLAIAKRHDELASLSVDFNSMVDHLGTLIHTQRDLFNSISHELRSPLARLTVSLALLRKQSTSGTEDLLGHMERDVARVDTLMAQILILARFESGLSSGLRHCVNFSQLVEEIAADGNFEALALGKSVSLRAVSSIILENADPHALRSACENIVRNAIRFSPPGGNVEVNLAISTERQPRVLLSVRDHGPGVPEEYLKSIFQPFFRVNRSEKGGHGNGLGLAIALEAVRLNGGVITASNVTPSGLNVEINLPFEAGRESGGLPKHLFL